jgi:uncharacterized membrane protein YukC
MLIFIYMQLIRTTVRLNEQLKKSAERKALDDNKSLQEILNLALEKYLEEEGKKEAKRIVFKTHNLGKPLDNLTRADFY